MATCSTIEGVPAGYRVWRGDVPPVLGQFAVSMLQKATKQHPYPYNQIVGGIQYGGQTVYAWASHHPWSTRGGQIVTGSCWDGISLLTELPPGQQGVKDSIATPDPNAAVFSSDGIDWGMAGLSALAGGAVVVGFIYMMKHAGAIKRRLR